MGSVPNAEQPEPDGSAPTSARLVGAAAALFRSRGYTATTTRQLGEALDIRGASLYHHISSKEDLLYDICSLALTQITDDFEAIAIDTDVTVERLRALFVGHTVRALTERDLHATMLTEFRSLVPAHRDEVLARRAAYEQLWLRQLQAAQTAGLVRADLDVKLLTLTLLNMLNWTIFWFEPDGARTPAELADFYFTVFFDGVAARNAA